MPTCWCGSIACSGGRAFAAGVEAPGYTRNLINHKSPHPTSFSRFHHRNLLNKSKSLKEWIQKRSEQLTRGADSRVGGVAAGLPIRGGHRRVRIVVLHVDLEVALVLQLRNRRIIMFSLTSFSNVFCIETIAINLTERFP